MGLSFTFAAGPRQLSYSQVRVSRDSWPYFTIPDSRLLNLEGQVPVFISPGNRVARLYSQALDSFLVVSYDSQGYGEGIRPHLHTAVIHKPCQIHYSYLITWDQANSEGDNKGICNKSFDEARACVEIW
jgi:hypothetical protein